MNEFEVRNEVMSYHLRHSSENRASSLRQWWGTCVVRHEGAHALKIVEPDPLWKCSPGTMDEFLRKKVKSIGKTPYAMFTVCLLYDTNLVHYVSFLYTDRQLLSFDPGVELYPHGQKTIVPRVEAAFRALRLIDSHSVQGACPHFAFGRKRRGVQFNGRLQYKLPADAFCQSWTLFFFVRLLYLPDRSLERIKLFLSDWCAIPPSDREYFITSFFIHPTLTYLPKVSKRYLAMLHPRHTKAEAMQQIFGPIEQCFFPKKK